MHIRWSVRAHKVVCQSTLSGLSVPVKWALRDQVMGIDRPSYGHSLPVLRASSTQSVGRFLGTFCGSAASLLCMMLYEDFVMLLCWFGDTTMPISWYFDDTLRLFSRKRMTKKARNSRFELLFWVSSGCGSRWLFVAFVRKCENGGFEK